MTDASIEEEFTIRQKLVLIDFACGMGIIVWGLVTQGWYMNEISAVFLGMGLLAGILGGLDQQTIAEEFVKGLADFAYAAIVIGIARGILVIAEGGMIIDTILQALATALAGAPAAVYTTFYVYRPWPALFAGSLEFWPGGAHHARYGPPDRAHGPQSRGGRHRAPVCQPDHQHHQPRGGYDGRRPCRG